MGDFVDFTQNATFVSGAMSTAISRRKKNEKKAANYIVKILNAIKQMNDYYKLTGEAERRSREPDAEMVAERDAIFFLNDLCQRSLSILLTPLHPEFSTDERDELFDLVSDMIEQPKEKQEEFAKSILDRYNQGIAGSTEGGLFTKNIIKELRHYMKTLVYPRTIQYISKYHTDEYGYGAIVFEKIIKNVDNLAKLDDSQRESERF